MNPKFRPFMEQAMANLPENLKASFTPIVERRIEAMEEAGVPEAEIIASFQKLAAKRQSPVDGEAEARRVVHRIYREFRWALKSAETTYEAIDQLLATAIRRCQDEVKHPLVQSQAVEKFTQMRNRVSEFTGGADAPEEL